MGCNTLPTFQVQQGSGYVRCHRWRLGFTIVWLMQQYATQIKRQGKHLTYARLIVRESLQHGGQGWLEYDRTFRQQAALDPTLKWNKLHPTILASILLFISQGAAYRGSGYGSTFCTLCRGVDHSYGQPVGIGLLASFQF